MKKVKIKYESHIFQNEYVDKYQEEITGNLEQNEKETIISFLTNEKELTKFVFQERNVLLYRENYILKFNLDKIEEIANAVIKEKGKRFGVCPYFFVCLRVLV